MLLLLLPMLACSKGNDEKDIRTAFDQYKAALNKSDAKAAAELVDSNSINYYGNIRRYALDYDSTQLMQLPVTDLVTVLLLKQQLPADSLITMDGKAVFIRSMEADGFADKKQMAQYTVSTVKVDNNTGTVAIKQDSTAIPLPMIFHKENGHWKLDVTQMLKQAQAVFEDLMNANHKTKMDIVDNWMQDMSPEQQANLWQPLRRSEPGVTKPK